jgi:hypothetical protein
VKAEKDAQIKLSERLNISDRVNTAIIKYKSLDKKNSKKTIEVEASI